MAKTAGGLLKDGTNAWKHFSERLSSQEIRDDHILNLTEWPEINADCQNEHAS